MAADLPLILGRTQICRGVYVAHWEFSRFTTRQPRRILPGAVNTYCELVAPSGRAISPLEVLGVTLPPASEGRHSPGLRFAVTAEVTPTARGRFGHRGALTWRLRVDRWIDVQQLGAHLDPA